MSDLVLPKLAGSQKELKAFLERRHPEYHELCGHWDFLEATYKGGRDWFSEDNIFRYVKEGDQEFDDRMARAYRFNHTREVTDLVQKYIYKSPIIRNTTDAPTEIKDFWLKATLSGLDINQFMKLASTQASIFGRPWIFTDTNVYPGEVLSVEDQKARGSRAYAYIVRPQDLLDVGYSEDGDVHWVLLREWVRDDQDPVHSSGDTYAQYRLWTKFDWHLLEVQSSGRVTQVVEIANGLNPIGVIPGFPLDHVVGDNRYSSPALINDIAYLDRAIANYLSNLDAIIQDQTFSQLAMPAQAVLPGTDAYKQLVEMGTKRVFLYDGEGGTPAYLSPDPRQAGMIVTVINKIINEIYHTIGMAGERTKSDNATGIDNSSGVAKAYDFERMNSLLTSKADSLENGENKLIELIMLWNKSKPLPPESELVKYPDTFDVRSLFDELTLAERLALVDAPASVRREQMNQVIEKLFPRLAEDLLDEMQDDLKDWPSQLDAVISAKFGQSGEKVDVPGTASATGKGGQPNLTTTKPKTKARSEKRQGQAKRKT